jgi:hypothetical protein
MKRLTRATTAIVAATLFGASAPMLTSTDENRLESARELDGNTYFEARITEVDGRAVGNIERVHLNTAGEVEALEIRWRAGWTAQPFTLVQSIDRFAYDPDMNVLIADANIERLRTWSVEDARMAQNGAGIPIERVGEGVLSGSQVVDPSGETYGRVVAVETDSTGRIAGLVTVRTSGLFGTQRSRLVLPADGARWNSDQRTIELASALTI